MCHGVMDHMRLRISETNYHPHLLNVHFLRQLQQSGPPGVVVKHKKTMCEASSTQHIAVKT